MNFIIENSQKEVSIYNHETQTNHSFSYPGEYLIGVEGYLNDCKLADTTFKFKVFDCNIILKNTFSPNGDGANDYWYIEGIEKYPNASIQIFNRWGVIIKSIGSNIPNFAWDGLNEDGSIVENGTYYYVLSFKTEKNPIKGYINLIR